MSAPIHILEGAVALYQRSNMKTRTYTARYHIEGERYVVRSTGKRDLEEAKKVAKETFYELIAANKRGFAIHNKTFTKAAEAFMEDARASDKANERKLKDYEAVIDRYFIPYFKGKAIDAISQESFENYVIWRRNYWISGPGANETTRKYVARGKTVISKLPRKEITYRSGEFSILRGIFESALRRKWVKRDQIPFIKLERREPNRRPALSQNDWGRICLAMKPYIDGSTDKHVAYDRKMLCGYMLFMAETGLRPGKEHQQLRWNDCETVTKVVEGQNRTETHIHIHSNTKTGKRTTVSSEETLAALDWIRCFSNWTAPSDFVFASEATGKAVISFAGSMEALLKSVGLGKDRHGITYTPYSLRHTYATDRLNNAHVDAWLLSKNMGTSIEMLKEHYGQDEPKQRADELIHDKVRVDPLAKHKDSDEIQLTTPKLTTSYIVEVLMGVALLEAGSVPEVKIKVRKKSEKKRPKQP
ncbi:MAG: tyrosine-type recombinase/integrase [Rhodospirillales bacterium]|nr:tyrosine-type recombinase/integrase [Rhodospirillales bacterium]